MPRPKFMITLATLAVFAACKAKPDAKHPAVEAEGPASPSAQSDGPSGAFGFAAVAKHTSRGKDISYWQISTSVDLPREQRDAILGGDWDGINKRLDPKTPGLKHPFDVEVGVTLINAAGQFQRKITGLGIESLMDSDDLFAILGPVEGDAEANGNGIAVIGTPLPSPKATLRMAEAEAPGAELVAELAAEFDGKATELIAAFEPDDVYGAGKPSAATLRPSAACVHVYRPKLPRGFDSIVIVQCGSDGVDDGKLAAVFLVGASRRQVLLGWTGWKVTGLEYMLRELIDLDGDGIDELGLHVGGHEYYSFEYLGWNGDEFAELPKLPSAP